MSTVHKLALDLGTHTGWAIGRPGAVLSGVWDLQGKSRFEGGGMRYLRFRQKLLEVRDAHPRLAQVSFEEVRAHKGVDAAHVYGGLLAVLTSFCEEFALPYAGVPVQTIKKFATGKANAPKSLMIEAVKMWGYDPEDDNHADALALFHYVFSGA